MKINVGAENISTSIRQIDKKLSNTRLQLSSGLKNPNPMTNPLLSTISKELSSDFTSSKNVQNIATTAGSTIQIASSILQSNTKLLHRMKDLAVRASSETLNEHDRHKLDEEFQQQIQQFDSNSLSQWGSRVLFDGTFATNYQVGLQPNEVLNVTFSDMTSNTVIGELDLLTSENARQALTYLDLSLGLVLNELTRLGLYSKQFEVLNEEMGLNSENLQGALSMYNDADFVEAIIDSNNLGVLREAANATLKMQFDDFEKLGYLVKESLAR